MISAPTTRVGSTLPYLGLKRSRVPSLCYPQLVPFRIAEKFGNNMIREPVFAHSLLGYRYKSFSHHRKSP